MTRLRLWLAHIAVTVVDSLAVLTGFYYSKKYAAILRRLGLRFQEPDGSNTSGMIILQIDGLGHHHLEQALRTGRLPHIRRILRRGGCVVSPWRCGLPSTTPACQAGIMFGDNEDIPAFRWYDKSRQASVVCKLPGTLALLQSRVAPAHTGLLTAGSSFVNLFDGGAASSLFTVSTLQPRRFFEGVRGAGFLALVLLNPVRTLRILYLAVQEYVTDALQTWSAQLRGLPRPPFGVYSFLRVLSNVVFREIVTLAVLVDIYRGVPAIYASYYGYDEVAHHFGLHSRAAYQALRGIDQSIGQIDRLRQAGLTRQHDLYLLSDHGLTPSEPFAHRYHQNLGRYIADQLDGTSLLLEHGDGEQHQLLRARFLLDEWKAIEKRLRPTAARLARRMRILLQRRLATQDAWPAWDWARHQDVAVMCSGSLAHVYFNITSGSMDLTEVFAAQPGLVIKLLAHPGIWLVAAREGGRTVVMSREGILISDGQGRAHIDGGNPLSRLPDPGHAAEQVRRLACFPSSGDLILFGNYSPDKDRVICFEDQAASHGGLGGAQDTPFIIHPRRLNWDLSRVRNSRDLYPLFATQRGLLAKEPEREEGTPICGFNQSALSETPS